MVVVGLLWLDLVQTIYTRLLERTKTGTLAHWKKVLVVDEVVLVSYWIWYWCHTGSGTTQTGAIPLLELGIHHPRGETHSADTDTFHHTVTTQLMKHESGIEYTLISTTNPICLYNALLQYNIDFIHKIQS